MMLTAALLLLQSVPTLIITPEEMADLEKIGSVCRAASDAAKVEETIASDWLAFIRTAAEAGGLSSDDQKLLIRMCGVYAVATRDSVRAQKLEVQRKLDEMSREFADERGE